MVIKRIFDLVFCLIGIIVFFPFCVVLGILIYFKLGSPIFFIQERVGKGEKIFKIIKFRTMTRTKDRKGNLLSDEERLTNFGRALRSTSLDEIPELLNVLKGDMSIVGPRPLLVEYLPLYNSKQSKRHKVLPGITGWAQINGRNSISWEKKFDLDIFYVENWSLPLDLKIIAITFIKVFWKVGIVQGEGITMEKFNGFN